MIDEKLPWMRIAAGEMGQAEVPGARHNMRIVGYAQEIGARWVETDETPWCAGFVGACLARAGLKHTGSMLARSYLEWGERCGLEPGAVVVLRRGSNPKFGHVGFLVEARGGKVYLLGGNQGNAVSVAAFMEVDVLGCRWPRDYAMPAAQDAPLVHEISHVEAEPQVEREPEPVEVSRSAQPAGKRRLETAAKSKTIFATLVAFLGWVVLQLQTGIEFALQAAQATVQLAPIQSALASVGGNLPNIGAGLIVGGFIWAIAQRISDGSRS